MFILQAQVLGAFSLSSASIGRLGAAQCGVGAIAASVLLTLWFCRRGGGMGVDSNADHAVFSRSKEEIRKLLIVSTCVTFASFSLLYLLLLTMFPNTTEDNAVMSAWRAAATSDQVMTVASYVLFSSIASISQCVSSIALFFVLSTIVPTVVVEHGGPVADTTSGTQPQATMHRLLLVGGSAVALFLVLFGSYLLKPSLNNNSGISSTTASPESAINTVTFLLRFRLL
ncbi:membrane-associated protein, putative, partial [Bodo saltans]